MRDRLVRADRPAELLTLLGVLDRQLHGVLRHAHQLRRDENLNAVHCMWLFDVQGLARHRRDAVHPARHVPELGALEPDELDDLMHDILISHEPPRGRTRLVDWLRTNADTVGRVYASEVVRHYRRSSNHAKEAA